MVKAVKTVLINELQLGTLDELRTVADAKGVVKSNVLAGYKTNVINALSNRDILIPYKNGDARINPGVSAELLVRKTRQPKIDNRLEVENTIGA